MKKQQVVSNLAKLHKYDTGMFIMNKVASP